MFKMIKITATMITIARPNILNARVKASTTYRPSTHAISVSILNPHHG